MIRMLTGIFEVGMLLCFAAAWPANIYKAYRARTTLGTSLPFMLIVELGYVCGMANKLINDDINYVMAFYIFDFVLVMIGIIVYFRNMAIDKAKGRDRSE